jgi:hypothetical protein
MRAGNSLIKIGQSLSPDRSLIETRFNTLTGIPRCLTGTQVTLYNIRHGNFSPFTRSTR